MLKLGKVQQKKLRELISKPVKIYPDDMETYTTIKQLRLAERLAKLGVHFRVPTNRKSLPRKLYNERGVTLTIPSDKKVEEIVKLLEQIKQQQEAEKHD